ncbi:MAG: hypothetical protein JSW00_18770 [Thermoplasmata archaeon]|nr:MAG: hypothetical protein JSW00_18770 [Thermoplasmata archaeon]
MNALESWFSKRVEEQLKDLASKVSSHLRVAIAAVVVLILIVLYYIAHQLSSTGFFTDKFGPFEMLFLYGSLIEWIVVATLEVFGRKDLSRDIDAFGGIIFVTIGGAWLFVVFPFEFVYFADMLPDSLRFLLQWISNDIAKVIILLWTIFHLVAAVYYGILRVFVRKARALESTSIDINEDLIPEQSNLGELP